MTGGGPGLMEAANKGVLDGRAASGSKSRSFGITIDLGNLEPESEHLDIKHHHRRFSSRLDDFMRLSHAVIVVQGGIGTLLELYYTWQLLQVGHIAPRPFILVDRSFWSGIIEWMRETQAKRGLVSYSDFDYITMVDTTEEVMEIIGKNHEEFLQSLDIGGERGLNPPFPLGTRTC